jgi:DNA modification methylase
MAKKLIGSLELNRIYQMDCLEGMRLLPDESIDLIIADPPYFETRGKFDFVWDNVSEYLDWCREWISECKRVLKANGAIYVYTTGLHQTQAIKLLNYFDEDREFEIINTIIWYYGNAPTMRTRHYLYRYDTIIYAIKGKKSDKQYTFNLEGEDVRMPHATKDKRNSPLGKLPVNVWYDIPAVKGNYKERTEHPTQKPLKICNRIINVSTNENDTVLIPFVGSGSECAAAARLNRNFIGFEIEPEYVRIANQRLENVWDAEAERKVTEGNGEKEEIE